jgi:hypothetical protein
VSGPEFGKRISSRNTFFMKRIFPLFWFVIIGLILVIGFASGGRGAKSVPPFVFVMPVALLALGWFIMRRLVFDLADAVYDEGDALRVRFGTEEERIALGNIINISFAGMSNPQRVTLTLRDPGRFGREVSFSPVQTFFGPLLRTSNPIVSDLIERVDVARRR